MWRCSATSRKTSIAIEHSRVVAAGRDPSPESGFRQIRIAARTRRAHSAPPRRSWTSVEMQILRVEAKKQCCLADQPTGGTMRTLQRVIYALAMLGVTSIATTAQSQVRLYVPEDLDPPFY